MVISCCYSSNVTIRNFLLNSYPVLKLANDHTMLLLQTTALAVFYKNLFDETSFQTKIIFMPVCSNEKIIFLPLAGDQTAV